MVATLISEQLNVVPIRLDQPETAVALGAHQLPKASLGPRTEDLAGTFAKTSVSGTEATTHLKPPRPPVRAQSQPQRPQATPAPQPQAPQQFYAPPPQQLPWQQASRQQGLIWVIDKGGQDYLSLLIVSLLLWLAATIAVAIPPTGQAMRGYQRRFATAPGWR